MAWLSKTRLPKRYEKCLPISVKGKSLSTRFNGREWVTKYTANLGRYQMNPGIRILPLPSANEFLGGRTSGQRSRQLVLGGPKMTEGSEIY